MQDLQELLINKGNRVIAVQEKERKQKQNAKLGTFTSQSCSDGKEMYIKA